MLTLDPVLRRLLQDAGWLLASDGAVLVAELVGTVAVARGLGLTEYGRLAIVWSVVGVAHLLVDVRAWEAVTRYLSEFTSRQQTDVALATLKLALLVEATVAVLGFGLLWLGAGWIATGLFGDPSLKGLIVLGAVALVVSAFDRTARAVMRVFDRFRVLSVCAAVESVSRLVLVVGALGVGGRARGVLLAHVAADLLAALILLTVAGREVRERLWPARATARLAAVRPHWREMLSFVGHSSLRATLKLATLQLDVLLLGYLRRPAEVGVYSAARRLARILEDLTDPLYFAVFPQFARAWVDARHEFVALLRRMAIGLALLTSAVVALGIVAAPVVVLLALGPAYATAVQPFRLLLVATGVAVATLWATPRRWAADTPRWRRKRRPLARPVLSRSSSGSCRRGGPRERPGLAWVVPWGTWSSSDPGSPGSCDRSRSVSRPRGSLGAPTRPPVRNDRRTDGAAGRTPGSTRGRTGAGAIRSGRRRETEEHPQVSAERADGLGAVAGP